MDLRTIRSVSRHLKPFLYVIYRGQRAPSGQKMILTYHGVSKSPRFNCVTQDLLKEQILWLKKKYSVVPLSALTERLQSPFIRGRSDLASITFDDGYDNFAELALPVLQACDCHATVFVPTGKVGSYNDWDEGFDNYKKMSIMSYKILGQLPKEFVEIGSHSISHIPLDRLTICEIEREMVESRVELEQNIGRHVQLFSFPFGIYPIGRRFSLYDNERNFLGGYRAACTTWWGRYNSLKHVHKLRRIGIWDSDSFSDYMDKLDGYYDWLVGKEIIGRAYKMMRSFL